MSHQRFVVLFFLLLTQVAFAQEDGTSESQSTTVSEEVEPEAEAAPPATSESGVQIVPGTAAESTLEGAAPAEAGAKGVEKIEVTGSHIKRVDVEGPAPILTLDSEYLIKSGYNNAADILRDNPVSSFGGDRESALGGSRAGTTLRGFDSGDILVLLNGQRVVSNPGDSAVDLHLIPMSAIERIEILKDGASAIYGSDALGGVINFITKKDYDGTSLNFMTEVPEDGAGVKYSVTSTYGKTGAKYNFLTVLQHRANHPLTFPDRSEFTELRSSDYGDNGSPGSWSEDGGQTFTAGNGADPCTGPTGSRGRCAFNFGPFMQITPFLEQTSALVGGSYQITDGLKLRSQVLVTRKATKGQLAAAPDALQVDAATFNSWGGATATNDVLFVYRTVEEGGPRKNTTNVDSYSAQVGLTGDYLDSWEWDVSTNYGLSREKESGVSGYFNKTLLTNLININQWNPFKAPGAKDDISSASYIPVQNEESQIATVDASTHGELGDVLGAPMSLAVGSQANWQTYDVDADAVSTSGDQWGGAVVAQGVGLRDFQSIYSELSTNFWQIWELQFAGRYDKFSDFGDTINPKVGTRIRPTTWLMLRGSWGTGFKAPTLNNLYGGQTRSFPTAIDPQGDPNNPQQFETFSGSNPNLKEETTNSYNVGMVLEPFKGFSISSDYWRTSQSNVIGTGTLTSILEAENRFGNGYLNGFGINVDRTQGDPVITAPLVNLARQDLRGLDLDMSYLFKLSGGWNLLLQEEHTRVFKFYQEVFPGLGIREISGTFSTPRWRNSVTLNFSNEAWGLGSVIRTVAGQDKTDQFGPADYGRLGRFRDHTEVDFRGSYNTLWKAQISLLIRNAFDTQPPTLPFNNSAGYVDASIYNPYLRTFILSYTQDF